MDADRPITVTEASKMLGIPAHAIRRYCNSGLVPHVRRARNGYRLLEPWQIDYIQVLMGLNRCGFTPAELRHYARLFRRGESTESERLAMLTTRKHQLRHEIAARQEAIDFIERQEEIAAGRRDDPYFPSISTQV